MPMSALSVEWQSPNYIIARFAGRRYVEQIVFGVLEDAATKYVVSVKILHLSRYNLGMASGNVPNVYRKSLSGDVNNVVFLFLPLTYTSARHADS